MRTGTKASRGYGVLWGVLVFAFVATSALWVAEIGQVLHGRSTPNAVVSTPTVSLLPAPGGILPTPALCQFVAVGPGNTIVMSVATGSVLTTEQAKNC